MRRNDDDFSIAAVLPISAPAGDRNYTQSEDERTTTKAQYPVKQLVELFVQFRKRMSEGIKANANRANAKEQIFTLQQFVLHGL